MCSLSNNTHQRGAKQHSNNTQARLRNGTISHRRPRARTSRTSTRSCRGTRGSRLGCCCCSSRGRIHALVAEDGVGAALLLETLRELVDGLALGEAVDAAVVVVFHGGVTLAAGAEGIGDVAGDGGAAGCVGDVGEDVDIACAGGGVGGHFGSVEAWWW